MSVGSLVRVTVAVAAAAFDLVILGVVDAVEIK